MNIHLRMMQDIADQDERMIIADSIWRVLQEDSNHFLKLNDGDRVLRILRFVVKSLNFHPIAMGWVNQWNQLIFNWSHNNKKICTQRTLEEEEPPLDYDDDENECNICQVHGHQLWSFNDYACDLCNKEISRKRLRKCGLVKGSKKPKKEDYYFQI